MVMSGVEVFMGPLIKSVDDSREDNLPFPSRFKFKHQNRAFWLCREMPCAGHLGKVARGTVGHHEARRAGHLDAV